MLMDNTIRYQKARFVTLVGAIINALLGIIKVIAGIFGHSHALFADGIHSFSDLITDALVLLASKYGSQDADENHPYGHQRIETVASFLISLLLIIVGLGIAQDAFEQLWLQTEHPSRYVLAIALVSILSNEALYHYTKRAGEKIQSDLLVANAWHHRSDAASSLIVLVGVAGSLMGFHHLDAIAACIVGLMIVKMGAGLVWSTIKELIDTAVEPALLARIEACINDTPGVQALHQLRSRSMGSRVLIDVHVLVDSHLTVSEGHYIAQSVHYRLMESIDEVEDVTVHIDPEDDEVIARQLALPPRSKLIPQLSSRWQNLPHHENIRRIDLHYLDGSIEIDVFFPVQDPTAKTTASIQATYQQTLTDLDYVAALRCHRATR